MGSTVDLVGATSGQPFTTAIVFGRCRNEMIETLWHAVDLLINCGTLRRIISLSR